MNILVAGCAILRLHFGEKKPALVMFLRRSFKYLIRFYMALFALQPNVLAMDRVRGGRVIKLKALLEITGGVALGAGFSGKLSAELIFMDILMAIHAEFLIRIFEMVHRFP
jgi:hypothetical protein